MSSLTQTPGSLPRRHWLLAAAALTGGPLVRHVAKADASLDSPPNPNRDKQDQAGGVGFQTVTLAGTVIPLSQALHQRGLACDPDGVEDQLVLRQDDPDATLTPILKDSATRAFWIDPDRFRDQAIRLTGRLYPGLPYLQVTLVRIRDAEDGVFRIPEYHCEVCAISSRFPQDCPCCQGTMEFRFKPE